MQNESEPATASSGNTTRKAHQPAEDPPAAEGLQDVSQWPDETQTVQFLHLDTTPSWIERITIESIHKLRKLAPSVLLLASDLIAVAASALLAIWLAGDVPAMAARGTVYAFLGTYCGVLVFAFLFAGLYSGIAMSSPGELKRITLTTTVTTLIMDLITFASNNPFSTHLSTFLIAWAFTLFAVPAMRAATRATFSRRGWWGRKAIIMGRDLMTASRLVQALKTQPRLGIKPVAILSTETDRSKHYNFGLPQLNGAGPALEHARTHGIDYAIITLSDLNEPDGLALIRRYETFFKHWLIVPYFSQNYSLWVQTKDLNGMLGLEVTNRLNRRSDQIAKRAMDLFLTITGGVVVLPICLLIALAIKLDSKGSVLYTQERIGKDGRSFQALKFRSMVSDADSILDECLSSNPHAKAQWETHQKIKNDPRITRVGKVLRKLSLDELPQLVNVLRGDMSLVGPRPCMPDQIALYGWVWNLYKRVRPGITGQWQVSGRNETSYKERAAMDAYYIRNWSIWLDIHILARTIAVVISRDGAY